MEFRRSGQSNQRRRRVLKDERSAAAGDEATESAPRRRRRSGNARQRPYTDAALVEHQARITDFIPKRPWTLLVIVLSLLAAVTFVEALYTHMSLGVRWVGERNLASLDPTTRGSLASWLSSTVLGLAAVACVSIYSIRRHRIDDYKGRYRLWLTAAVVCVLASIDATTDLHRVPQHLLHLAARKYAGGTSLGEYTGFWWVAFNLAFVGIAAGRLSVEMRRSIGASVWLVTAAAGYFLVGAVELGYLTGSTEFLDVLFQSSAKMGGDAALLFAVATYARYVYLDSQGILAQRRAEREERRRQARAEREERRRAKAEARAAAAAEKAARKEAKRTGKATNADATDEESEETEQQEDGMSAGETKPAATRSTERPAAATTKTAPSSPSTPSPSASSSTANPTYSSGDDEDEDDEDLDSDDRNLSRAERKRLRKQAKRESRRAA